MAGARASCIGAFLLFTGGSCSDGHSSGHADNSHSSDSAAPAPPPAPATYTKMGEGMCNEGVGGFGEFKCVGGGKCNAGGQPLSAVTETGTGCEDGEYLECDVFTDMTEESCRTKCSEDADCVGFMVSHAGAGGGKCELHTKLIESADAPLECYKYEASEWTLMGHEACRTADKTGPNSPVPDSYYGDYNLTYTADLAACKKQCEGAATTCVGIEYAQNEAKNGKHKCEVHFQELSEERGVQYTCWKRDNATEADKAIGISSAATRAVHVLRELLAPLLVIGGIAALAC
eukprot:TRINITY_DN18190_c0_g1_i1.p1 TRINITY_DN18190_c0_g1~~TRINITY_DN18190_c0_g1_i1.p1  ORF type:complete len:316 (-),score=72.92 TRINITY_DN18190_c0_g1_i1:171-1037(-)